MRTASLIARSRRPRLVLPAALLITLSLAVGCGGGRGSTAGPAGARAAPRPAQVAPERAAEEAREADLGMAAAVAARDAVAFARHVSLDTIFFTGSGPVPGRAAVAVAWAPFFQADGPRLEWAPDRALASSTGDLAFTFGAATFRPARGEPSAGRYLTAWRRDADGKLRAVLDGDAEPLPPLPATVARRTLRTIFSEEGDLVAEGGLLLENEREVGQYLLFSRREKGRLVTLGEGGHYRPAKP
jgi:ketosteroid isomerase-like protein